MDRTRVARVKISLPDIDDTSLEEFAATPRLPVKPYRLCKKAPVMLAFLERYGPDWDVAPAGPGTPPSPSVHRGFAACSRQRAH